MSNSREMKMNQLNECVKIWEVTLAEAAKEFVFMFYEAAGFYPEQLVKELAELIDVDRSHISAIELGKVGVSLDVVFRLCEVLEITPKQLFDFRD